MTKIKSLLIFLFLLNTAPFLNSQPYKSVQNDYFKRGEKLVFRVAFHSLLTGNLTAGSAMLEITPENKQFNGRNTYHAVGTGRTKGLIEMFYHVEERFESYFDADALLPFYFTRKTVENSYQKTDAVTFRHKDKLAVSSRKVTSVPENVQDIVSAFYYARCMDISNFKPGKEFSVPFFLDDTVYHSKVRFMGRETVKTKLGKFSCLKLKPMVATGYVFEDPYPVTLWVTDDQNRIPILIESELAVGSVRVELTSYSGLANSLNFQPR